MIEKDTGMNSTQFDISEWKGNWPTRIRLDNCNPQQSKQGDIALGTTSSGSPSNLACWLESKPKKSRSPGGLRVQYISTCVNGRLMNVD